MRILFVTPYVPNRIRVRPFEMVRSLSRRGHHVSLAAPCCSRQDWEDLTALGDLGVEPITSKVAFWRPMMNCLAALPGRLPLQAAYSWDPALWQRIEEMLNRTPFDIIHFEHLRGALYASAAREFIRNSKRRHLFKPKRPTIVWDSVDCIHRLFQDAARMSSRTLVRLMTRIEMRRTERYEAWLLSQFDHVLVTSEAEKIALQSINGTSPDYRNLEDPGCAAPITVIPNGVDLEYFHTGKEKREEATLVFVGKMSYHANVTAVLDFVRNVFPKIVHSEPNVRLWIVGKSPVRQIRSLENQTTFGSSGRRGAIAVTGGVPDVRPYLHQATIAIAPMTYGAGIQNKVLEAMACGVPVIASPTAASALHAVAGRDIILARTPEEFARAVLHLLRHPWLRLQIAEAGRRYVETFHQWDRIAAVLENVYQPQVDVSFQSQPVSLPRVASGG